MECSVLHLAKSKIFVFPLLYSTNSFKLADALSAEPLRRDWASPVYSVQEGGPSPCLCQPCESKRSRAAHRSVSSALRCVIRRTPLTVRVAVQYDRPPPSLRTHILQPFLMSVGGVYYQFRDRCVGSVALVQMRKPCDVCRKRPSRRVRCHFCRLHIGPCCTHWSWFESTGLAGSFWIIECSRCVAPPEPEPEP